jgi:hypothetical protein
MVPPVRPVVSLASDSSTANPVPPGTGGEATADSLGREFAEEALGSVQPGGGSGSEVQMHAWAGARDARFWVLLGLTATGSNSRPSSLLSAGW